MRRAQGLTRWTMFGMLAAALLTFAPTGAAAKTDGRFAVGEKAPDFTLRDLDGKEVRLSDFAGKKAVLLVFMAMRCGVCLQEAPHVEQLHRTYADKGLAVVGVNVDGVGADIYREATKDIGLETSFTILLDPEFTVTDTYTEGIVPLTYVIDREGIIRYSHTNYEPGVEKEYEKAVLEALKS